MRKTVLLAAILLSFITFCAYAQTSFMCSYAPPIPSYPTPQPLLQAGSCLSNNGWCHTPKGNLHIIWVFVDFNNEQPDADNSWWPVNGIPDYAALNGTSNNLLDVSTANPSGNYNLSSYYNAMSNGKFTLTGEVFKVSIDKIYAQGTTLDYSSMMQSVFTALATQLQGRDLSVFDKRQNDPEWAYDNSIYNSNGSSATGDGVIDYVAICFRGDPLFGIAGGAYNFSASISNTFNGVTKTYGIGVGDYLGYRMKKEDNMTFFTHEFAHNLYNSAHYMNANNLSGVRYYQTRGWGMMGSLQTIFTANAWEKWWLGWINMDTRTITSNGTYILKDFITQNDALRIKIPNTNSYLWLENHQLIHSTDKRISYITESPITKGIYAFISAEEAADCGNPSSYSFYAGNVATNGFKMLSAKGNWDYTWDATLINGWHNFHRNISNPISGTTDANGVRADFKYVAGLIDICTDVNNHYPANVFTPDDGEGIMYLDGVQTYGFAGSAGDVFQTGNEIGVNGIVPALNYPKLDVSNTTLGGYQLNGLSVKITSYNTTTGEYTIEVKYDQYGLTKDIRFAANQIDLPNLSNDANADLIVTTGKTLTIDKSGSSNTKVSTTFSDFIMPTIFTVKNGALMKLETNSNAVVKTGSTLQVLGTLEINDGAKLTIQSNSKLQLDAGGTLIIKNGGKVEIQSTGKLLYNQNGILTLQDANSVIEVQDNAKIEIGSNATFTWNGNGYLRFNNPGTFAKSNVVATTAGNNARFYKEGVNIPGSGYSQKFIEVADGGSLSVDRNMTEFKLSKCKAMLGANAIVDVEPQTYFENVTFTSFPSGVMHGGLWVYGQQNTNYVNACTFENAKTGIVVWPNISGVGVSSVAKFTSSTFTNCEQGIFIGGKGAEITSTTFNGGRNAIFLSGIQNNCLLSSVTIHNYDTAVHVKGSTANTVTIKQSTINNDNVTGVYGVNASLVIGCSQVNNNMGYNVVSASRSYLNIDPGAYTGAGNNNFSATLPPTARPVKLLSSNGIRLNNGSSNFLTNGGYDIEGSIMVPGFPPTTPPVSPIIYVKNNYWNPAGTAPTTSNYHISLYGFWGSMAAQFNDQGQSLNAPSSYAICNSGTGTFPGGGGTFINKPLLIIAGTSIQDLFTQGVSYMEVADYSSALNKFYTILNYNYNTAITMVNDAGNPASEFSIWYPVIDQSYVKLMECITEGVATGQLTPTATAIINPFASMQNNLINKLGANNAAITFHYYTDKAMIYRLIGDYTTALDQLNAITPTTQNNVELLSYYTCIVDKEQKMSNGTIAKENYSTQSTCTLNLSEPVIPSPSPAMPTGLQQQSSIEEVMLYPNPVGDELYIVLPTAFTFSRIELMDITGRILLSKSMNKSGVLNIPVGIQNGTYFIQIVSDKGTSTHKVTIMK